ncbi:hypothetical protein KKG45_10385, partial [bacterium]|nr:hypothetical protein [bacterium]
MENRKAKILLCILVLMAGGCEESALDPVQPAETASRIEDKDWLQDYLANLWEASNHGDWDVISG